MASWIKAAHYATIAVLSRFPFVNAVLLALILAERAPGDRNEPPFPAIAIYIYIGALVVVGMGMTYDLQRKASTIGYVALLAVAAFSILTGSRMRYDSDQWLKIRIVHRIFGQVATFTLFAFLMDAPKKSKRLKRVAEGAWALYTMCYAYLLVNSPTDRALFVSRFGTIGTYIFYVIVTVIAACAMVYVNGGPFVVDAAVAALFVNVLFTALVYVDFQVWTRRHSVPFWVQWKIISEDIGASLGLFLMCTAKVYRRKPIDH